MDFCIEAACGSSIGRVRRNNEDNFLFDGKFLPQINNGQYPPLTLYGSFEGDVHMAVLDGMGGMDYGEVAAATAAETLCRLCNHGELRTETLEEACLRANREVWEVQSTLGTHNVGTTLAMLSLVSDRLYAINVGDSRIFGLREEQLVQLSKDHTDEAYMKKRGIVGRKPRLTQYLGMDPGQIRPEPHIVGFPMQEGDIYLICSDGLTDMVDQENICRLLTVSGTASACVESLITAALENGGHDNITVIVCRILERKATGRIEDDTITSKGSVARLADIGLSWGRKLWSSIQDTAKHIRRN